MATESAVKRQIDRAEQDYAKAETAAKQALRRAEAAAAVLNALRDQLAAVRGLEKVTEPVADVALQQDGTIAVKTLEQARAAHR